MKYTLNLRSVDTTLLRVIVLRFLADLELAAAGSLDKPSIDHPVLACGTDENACLRMASERSLRTSVSVYQGATLSQVLFDIYFHEKGDAPHFASLRACYDLVAGTTEITQFKTPW